MMMTCTLALWPCDVSFYSYVVEPYRKYPNLLEVLLNFLKTEQAPGIRREVTFVQVEVLTLF